MKPEQVWIDNGWITKSLALTAEGERIFEDVVRHWTNEELFDVAKEVLEGENECRIQAGIGPDDDVPFFCSPLTGPMSRIIVRELDRREHGYVDQGVTLELEHVA
jgi:hypothetical protein